MGLPRVVAALLLAASFGAGAQWQEGVHYEVIAPAAERDADTRHEVLYAFWYGCPSCFTLEPHVVRWLADKPDDVDFVRVAASMTPQWRVHARAYYTAAALDVLDPMHREIYNDIHVRRNRLGTVDAVAELFSEHTDKGADEVRATMGSFAIDRQMRQGDALTRRHRLTAVPSIVVNGRYRTDPGRAQGFENVMKVVDHLLELDRRAAGPAVR